jgi:hypothetical protein
VMILPIFVLFIGFLFWVVHSFGKKQSGIKTMLFGISVILTGGIIAVDHDSNLGGIEYIFVLAGLMISVSGFLKDDR